MFLFLVTFNFTHFIMTILKKPTKIIHFSFKSSQKWVRIQPLSIVTVITIVSLNRRYQTLLNISTLVTLHGFWWDWLGSCLPAHRVPLIRRRMRILYWRFGHQQRWLCLLQAEWLLWTRKAVLLVGRWRWASHLLARGFPRFQVVHWWCGLLQLWWSVAHCWFWTRGCCHIQDGFLSLCAL